MPSAAHEKYLSPTPADIETIKPLGDLVLVRRLPDDAMVNSIHVPENARDKREGVRRGVVVAVGPGDATMLLICSRDDGRDECLDDAGLSPQFEKTLNHVLSHGFGKCTNRACVCEDRGCVIRFGTAACPGEICGASLAPLFDPENPTGIEPPEEWGENFRSSPMHVSVGDEVIYPRVPANDVRVGDDEYTFVHEEGSIWAVIEREAS